MVCERLLGIDPVLSARQPATNDAIDMQSRTPDSLIALWKARGLYDNCSAAIALVQSASVSLAQRSFSHVGIPFIWLYSPYDEAESAALIGDLQCQLRQIF